MTSVRSAVLACPLDYASGPEHAISNLHRRASAV